MRHPCRSLQFLLASLALGGGSQAVAQDNTAATPPAGRPIAVVPAPPSDEGTVGPAQLRDFRLGNETQQAPPPTDGARSEPITTVVDRQPRVAPQPQPANPSPTQNDPAPSATATGGGERAAPRAAAERPAEAAAAAQPLPPTDFSPAIHNDDPEVVGRRLSEDARGMGLWPWALVLALALGAGGYFLGRRRRPADGLALAGGPSAEPYVAPEAVPASPRLPRPERLQPVAPPPPPPAAPELADDGGIVAVGLKANLLPTVEPFRMVVNADGSAALDLGLEIGNSGGATARDMRLSMKLINAGPAQDQELMAFFHDPLRRTAELPDLPPADRLSIRVDVTFQAADIRPVEMEGRRLVIPMLALAVRFRHGRGETQMVGSWLVGAGDADAEKLGPFRLDLGARQWDKVALRELMVGELRG